MGPFRLHPPLMKSKLRPSAATCRHETHADPDHCGLQGRTAAHTGGAPATSLLLISHMFPLSTENILGSVYFLEGNQISLCLPCVKAEHRGLRFRKTGLRTKCRRVRWRYGWGKRCVWAATSCICATSVRLGKISCSSPLQPLEG